MDCCFFCFKEKHPPPFLQPVPLDTTAISPLTFIAKLLLNFVSICLQILLSRSLLEAVQQASTPPPMRLLMPRLLFSPQLLQSSSQEPWTQLIMPSFLVHSQHLPHLFFLPHWLVSPPPLLVFLLESSRGLFFIPFFLKSFIVVPQGCAFSVLATRI